MNTYIYIFFSEKIIFRLLVFITVSDLKTKIFRRIRYLQCMLGSIIIHLSVENPIFGRARERLDWIRERLDSITQE